MTFEGNALDACGVVDINCTVTYIVAVSGDGPNICGHMLLYAGPRNGAGYYYQVAGIYGYPRYMDEGGYRQYLREANKVELRRVKVSLPDPAGAQAYLEQLLSGKWTWLVVPNNCVAFVEKVLQAGGLNWGSYSNCPAIATAPTVSERLQSFYNSMEKSVYQLYGVPQF